MITLTILLTIIIATAIFILIGSSAFLVVFGDVIIATIIVVTIIRVIRNRNNH